MAPCGTSGCLHLEMPCVFISKGTFRSRYPNNSGLEVVPKYLESMSQTCRRNPKYSRIVRRGFESHRCGAAYGNKCHDGNKCHACRARAATEHRRSYDDLHEVVNVEVIVVVRIRRWNRRAVIIQPCTKRKCRDGVCAPSALACILCERVCARMSWI